MANYAYRVRRSDAPVKIKPALPPVAQPLDVSKDTVADVVVPTGREDYGGMAKSELVLRAEAAGVDSSGTKAELAERLGGQ